MFANAAAANFKRRHAPRAPSTNTSTSTRTGIASEEPPLRVVLAVPPLLFQEAAPYRQSLTRPASGVSEGRGRPGGGSGGSSGGDRPAVHARPAFCLWHGCGCERPDDGEGLSVVKMQYSTRVSLARASAVAQRCRVK